MAENARRFARLLRRRSPDVSLSRRWTIPILGRENPPSAEPLPPLLRKEGSFLNTKCQAIAFAKVPLATPAPGCTTITAALLITARYSSSKNYIERNVLGLELRSGSSVSSTRFRHLRGLCKKFSAALPLTKRLRRRSAAVGASATAVDLVGEIGVRGVGLRPAMKDEGEG